MRKWLISWDIKCSSLASWKYPVFQVSIEKQSDPNLKDKHTYALPCKNKCVITCVITSVILSVITHVIFYKKCESH